MSPQPSLGDRALDTCPVFVGTPASAQEWQVDQLDGNPLVPVDFGRVGRPGAVMPRTRSASSPRLMVRGRLAQKPQALARCGSPGSKI
jgi:hypothetical protein